MTSVSTHFTSREWLNGVKEIWYGRYAIGHYSKLLIFNSLRSAVPSTVMLSRRWNNDDAISHDPLCMAITNQTIPYLTKLHLT
jgi:hypothetical protein